MWEGEFARGHASNVVEENEKEERSRCKGAKEKKKCAREHREWENHH